MDFLKQIAYWRFKIEIDYRRRTSEFTVWAIREQDGEREVYSRTGCDLEHTAMVLYDAIKEYEGA